MVQVLHITQYTSSWAVGGCGQFNNGLGLLWVDQTRVEARWGSDSVWVCAGWFWVKPFPLPFSPFTPSTLWPLAFPFSKKMWERNSNKHWTNKIQPDPVKETRYYRVHPEEWNRIYVELNIEINFNQIKKHETASCWGLYERERERCATRTLCSDFRATNKISLYNPQRNLLMTRNWHSGVGFITRS